MDKFSSFTGPALNKTLVNTTVNDTLTVIQFIHFLHLTERSYARHMALGGFYEEMPGLLDAFAEQIQVYDIELRWAPAEMPDVSAEQVLNSLQNQFKSMHRHLATLGDNALTNVLEDMMSLVQHTLYKLTRLS